VTSTFTLPAFTTKSKQERVVDLVPDVEIFKMLVALTEGRATRYRSIHTKWKASA
jgi:hypothetical protein